MSTPNEHIESGFEPPGCTPPDTTPSAPSLQSVAEGAANELVENLKAGFTAPAEQLALSALRVLWTSRLVRHFAPVYAALTERDERLGRLEEAREDALQALGEHPESETDLAQRIREIRQEGRDLFHDLTALRTRCEELEGDKARLELDLDAAGRHFDNQAAVTGECLKEIAALRTHCKELEKGLRDAVNAACSCGGEPAESAKACPACMVWHRIHAARKEGQQAHQKGEGL